MTSSIRNVCLAINQPLTETGIVKLLSESNDYSVATNLSTRDQILQHVNEIPPDLLIVDYAYPHFFSLQDLSVVLHANDHLNVLVISSDDNKESIIRCVEMGIKGYITNHCGKNEFMLAVESTSRGDKFFCSKILDILLHVPLKNSTEQGQSGLTVREKEMLRFLAKGFSTQQIAETLFLSPHTVQTHRKSIIKKLKIKSPTEFVIHALDMGLIAQRGL